MNINSVIFVQQAVWNAPHVRTVCFVPLSYIKDFVQQCVLSGPIQLAIIVHHALSKIVNYVLKMVVLNVNKDLTLVTEHAALTVLHRHLQLVQQIVLLVIQLEVVLHVKLVAFFIMTIVYQTKQGVDSVQIFHMQMLKQDYVLFVQQAVLVALVLRVVTYVVEFQSQQYMILVSIFQRIMIMKYLPSIQSY